MANYATATTVLALLPGLPQTTTTSPGYTTTVAVITSHLTRADNIIDGKICRRYDVASFKTSGAVPPILITLAEDITSYYTYRSLFTADGQNASDWTDKFKDAITVLDEIRNGDMDLVNSVGTLILTLSTSSDDLCVSNTKDYTPTFLEDTATSWVVDEDKLDDIDDERD